MSGEPEAGALSAADRAATLLSIAFIVDQADLSRGDGDGDLVGPLVFAAILQANRAVLRTDPEAQSAFGDTGLPLPDEIRRPISISAVANTLRLPFETVRRKVKALADAGLCVVTPAGAYVPKAVILSRAHVELQAARMARLAQFGEALRTAGFLAQIEAPPHPAPHELMRVANRLLADYLFRSCDRMIELVRGVLDGFVLLGLCAANAEGLAEAGPAAAADGAGAALVAHPARALGERLRLPPETTRRRLLKLESAGYAVQRPDGWVAAAPPGELARIERIAVENLTDVRRLFARLRGLADAQALEAEPPGLAAF